MPEASWKNGVRSLRKSEMGRLRKLLGDVFFTGLPDMQSHAINEENASNLLVVVEDGEAGITYWYDQAPCIRFGVLT